MNSDYELRVLSGCHAGARASVQAGALIGTDLDCDIILADDDLPGTPGPIGLDETRWTLGDEEPALLNQPVRWGAVWITVARPEQAWPPAPDAANHNSEAAEQSVAHEQAAQGTDDASHPEIGGDSPGSESGADVMFLPHGTNQMTHSSRDRVSIREKSRHRNVYVLMLVGGLLTLGILFAVWQPGASTADMDIPASGRVASQEHVALIRQALRDLGHDGQVNIVVQDSGTVIVQGWVGTSSEKDTIAAAMTRIWPMPGLQLYVADDVLEDVGRLLASMPGYHAVSVQDERIHIEGIVMDHKGADAVRGRVQNRYPALVIVTDRLMPLTVVQDRFSDTLQRAGVLHDIMLEWEPPYLQADVRSIPVPQQDAVHKRVDSFNRDHWNRVRVLGSPIQGPGLPFDIRSVVSGPQPYVVLSDGKKILKGGQYQGYRLITIEAGRLIFEGEDEVVVQR